MSVELTRSHVAAPMWRYLRSTCAEVSELRTSLTDVPVVLDNSLTGGQWEIHEGGEVVESGDIAPAPEGMAVDYHPTVGWFAYSPSLITGAIEPLAFPLLGRAGA